MSKNRVGRPPGPLLTSLSMAITERQRALLLKYGDGSISRGLRRLLDEAWPPVDGETQLEHEMHTFELTEREAEALTLRQQGLNYREIGEQMSVSRERARQLVWVAQYRLHAQRLLRERREREEQNAPGGAETAVEQASLDAV